MTVAPVVRMPAGVPGVGTAVGEGGSPVVGEAGDPPAVGVPPMPATVVPVMGTLAVTVPVAAPPAGTVPVACPPATAVAGGVSSGKTVSGGSVCSGGGDSTIVAVTTPVGNGGCEGTGSAVIGIAAAGVPGGVPVRSAS